MISTTELAVAEEIMDWIQNFLMAPNEAVKRPRGDQVVCPFVKTAVQSGALQMEFHRGVNGQDVDDIVHIMRACAEPFKRMPPHGPSGLMRKALMVVFPNIEASDGSALDEAHHLLKDDFVEQGLMLGQFHPRCEERGVYNRAFKASVAPYPLIAIRHMAVHDIIFLHANERWFKAYNVRF